MFSDIRKKITDLCSKEIVKKKRNSKKRKEIVKRKEINDCKSNVHLFVIYNLDIYIVNI